MTAAIRITPLTAIVLRHLIATPRRPQYATELAKLTGERPLSVMRVLHKLEGAGWLTSTAEPRLRYQPRRFYTLTGYGIHAAREELKTWTFTD